MRILKFLEKIHTECGRIENPVLETKAISLDKLKIEIDYQGFKSCDYIRRKYKSLFFIEISDLKYEISNLIKTGMTNKKAEKCCKEGIRIKLSDSIHIYEKMVEVFNIKKEKSLKKYAFILVCISEKSDVIVWDRITQALQNSYQPKLYDNIKLIPYSQLKRDFFEKTYVI